MVPAPFPSQPLALTEAHLEQLRRLQAEGFELARFPFFEAQIGVKKFGCAALLEPLPEGSWKIAAPPAYVVEGNLSATVEQGGEQWFVWKSHRLRASGERLATLRGFEQALRALLALPPPV
jgi:hypothetical protein